MPFGVSNSFKRGTMRTYVGRQNRIFASANTQRPRIRIRMDENGMAKEEIVGQSDRAPSVKESTEPSSPASRALFSDAEQHTSASPPSSPPLRRASPPLKSQRPCFSFLKRKRSEADDNNEPLSEVNDNANSRRRPVKRTRLTQMQIDLGGETRRACKDCGMEYIPSNREDAALHKEFHSMNIGGVDMGTGFNKDSKIVERWYGGEVVAMIDSNSSLAMRRRTKRVLDVVRSDLGAIDISEERLWGLKDAFASKKNAVKKDSTRGEDDRGEKQDQYKVFLYLAGDKCVGLCLAERIRHASRVVNMEKPRPGGEAAAGLRSSCIQTETSMDSMLLGISRIWVSKSHRRKAIATTLLECARNNFFYGIEVPKKMVAFSQPTESGGQLAEGWYGEKAGWHVYTES